MFKSLNIYAPKSTIGDVDPIKGPSYASMTCSENFTFNTNSIYRSLPKIISYLPLAESSKLHFHVMTFVVLSTGKVKSILTLKLVVMFPACVCHCIAASFWGHSFSTSLCITIVELHPVSKIIRKFLNFVLHFLVFIHPCRIPQPEPRAEHTDFNRLFAH